MIEYEVIKEFNNAEVEEATSKNNSEELLHVVLSVALYYEDSDYAEKICIQLSKHKNFNVRGNVILGFSHIARIHKKLNEKLIKPIIVQALKDNNEYVRNHATNVKEDTKHYLGWEF